MTKSLMDTLGKVALFGDLTEAELEALARRMSRRPLLGGELLFAEGDPCQGFFVVESGALRIFKTSPSGREQVLTIERTGGIVAELPVFDDGPYPASCSAVVETSVLFLSKVEFRELCIEHPTVTLKVLKATGKRLRRLVALIEELSFTTVRQRLAGLLLRIADKEGVPTGDGLEITIPANQEIGAHIGTVRELVSRNLSRFQSEGMIRMDGKQVVILERKRLEEELQSD
ncbi:MAG: Crp/Fnr family transcriptional regulator [Thermoanaerobaculia bacterium]|nr:Crp/Fnr family transcriptional regulator [Thermoanaerobaculia bacterium]